MHGYIFYPSFSYIQPNFDIWIKFLFLFQLFPCPVKIWFKNRVCEYWSIHLPKTTPPLCFINTDINLNGRMIWKWGRGMHHFVSLSINRFWYNPIINFRRFPTPFPCIWKLIWVTPSPKIFKRKCIHYIFHIYLTNILITIAILTIQCIVHDTIKITSQDGLYIHPWQKKVVTPQLKTIKPMWIELLCFNLAEIGMIWTRDCSPTKSDTTLGRHSMQGQVGSSSSETTV